MGNGPNPAQQGSADPEQFVLKKRTFINSLSAGTPLGGKTKQNVLKNNNNNPPTINAEMLLSCFHADGFLEGWICCSLRKHPVRPPVSLVAAVLLGSMDIIRGGGCNGSHWTDIHLQKASACFPISLTGRGLFKEGHKGPVAVLINP